MSDVSASRVPQFVTLVVCALFITGCPHSSLEPLFQPKHQAIHLIEVNRIMAKGGYKAIGVADGYFRDAGGKKRHFSLDATLLLIAPDHLRFVLENAFGGEEMQVGMNTENWWVVAHRPRSQTLVGQHGEVVTAGGALPLDPSQLIECLGWTRVPAFDVAQRVVDDYQQLMFVSRDSVVGSRIEKEYWLDRFPPFLIRRIVFRDKEGRVVVSSDLSDYRRVGESGPEMPHKYVLSWPLDDARLFLKIRRWRPLSRLTRSHRAFSPPVVE